MLDWGERRARELAKKEKAKQTGRPIRQPARVTYESKKEHFLNSLKPEYRNTDVAREVFNSIIIKRKTAIGRINYAIEILPEVKLFIFTAIIFCYEVYSKKMNIEQSRKMLVEWLSYLITVRPPDETCNKARVGYFVIRALKWADDSLNMAEILSKEYRDSDEIGQLKKDPKPNFDCDKRIIPWNFVTFNDGILCINMSSRNIHFIFKTPKAKREFELIDKDKLCKLPPIIVIFHKQKFKKVLNMKAIDACLELLLHPTDIPNLQKRTKLVNPLSVKTTNDVFRYAKQHNSWYLEYLGKLHLNTFSIYCSTEQVVHTHGDDKTEISFIFTVCEVEDKILVVYENSEVDRSTILFWVKSNRHEEAIKMIHQYFASYEENKRQSMQTMHIDFSTAGILAYKRINHTTTAEWEKKILFFINRL